MRCRPMEHGEPNAAAQSQARRFLRMGREERRMNREQAEHLLDAYLDMENSDGDSKARQSLREVILDAMTSYRIVSYPNISSTKPIVTY